MTGLSKRLSQPDLLVAPGCYDALSALLVERAGFDAAYVSGASIAYTRFGRPDIGLVSFSEVADTVGSIRERVSIPLIVDMDTGFGNALNVRRTVQVLARAGASALQLEDQVTPKRCGHLSEKRLIGVGEMVGKIKAALDARPSDDVLLVARTDAIAACAPVAAEFQILPHIQIGKDPPAFRDMHETGFHHICSIAIGGLDAIETDRAAPRPHRCIRHHRGDRQRSGRDRGLSRSWRRGTRQEPVGGASCFLK